MKIGISATVLLAGLAQNAAFAAACSPTSCSGQISMLDVEANGDVYVALVGGLAGLTGCTPNEGEQPFLTLPAASANMKLVYATLLAAQMAGRSVTLALAANSNGCTIRYVTLP
jgi:hypothetical protein